MPSEHFAQKYRLVAFWVIGGAVLFGCTAILLPFVPALLWAAVLSVLMFPFYRRYRDRWATSKLLKGDRADTAASLATVIMTILIIMIPLALIGIGLFAQLGGVSNTLAGHTEKPSFESVLTQVDKVIEPFVDQVGGQFSVKEYVMTHQEEIAQGLRAPLTKFAGQAGFTILTIVIALLTMFFMLRDGKNLLKPACELIPLPRPKTIEIMEKVAETIRAVFIGTVLVALIQGGLMGLTFLLVGIPNSLLLGVACAIMAIIPLLGTPVIYVPVALIAMSQGKTTEGIVILAVGLLFVSQIDNILKPFLIGGRTNLHPLGIFFSILGGVLLIGPIGVMAGPMLLTILLALVDVVRSWVGEAPQLDPSDIPA